uniref:Radial spoke head 10-like B n=1 Tax=Callorhinchus milii TaxID=7868 RepID=A0A4W3H6B8_CALMI|eukprot:gi/632952277/ref/XP_007891763.1/ PREDICTED: radial spoke head 10 homolog B isoform X2 [Callorhinchus milii]
MAKGGDKKKPKKGKEEKGKKGKDEKEPQKKAKVSEPGPPAEEAERVMRIESIRDESESSLKGHAGSEQQVTPADDAAAGVEPGVEEPTKEVTELPVHYNEPILTKLIVQSYEGERIHGLYEGEAVANFQEGHIYQGQFSEGLMHGRGTYIWNTGLKYEGDFSMNVPSGNGLYTWPDGSTYEGEVWNGIRHGNGTFRSSDQVISYTGQWDQGRRHGKGTVYYNREGSSWFQGEWVNNVSEGWGIRRYVSGNVYEGEWKNFKRHGDGTMRWFSTNEEYTGQWENGIQHGFGTQTWLLKRVPGSQYPLRNEYTGELANGLRHGRGKFFYANGAIYDGHWELNKKHGWGKIIFKNGLIFDGEFSQDRMVEFPSFWMDGISTPDLSEIRTHSPLETGGIAAILQHNVELDISSLLEKIPIAEREEELIQVKYAILRHFTELKRMYGFYSCLGHEPSIDNTFLLNKLQFWRFLKDCKFHHHHLTIVEMDRIFYEDFAAVEEIHSPFEMMLLRKFLSSIVILGYHIYYKKHEGPGPILVDCFNKLMDNKITPYACSVRGILFQEHRKTLIALDYINKCWKIYSVYCRQNHKPPYDYTMTMRHFLWMLKDLDLLSIDLTPGQIVRLFSEDNPAVSNGRDFNMDLEITFLEFMDSLLGCAVIYVTKDVIKESETPTDLKNTLSVVTDTAGIAGTWEQLLRMRLSDDEFSKVFGIQEKHSGIQSSMKPNQDSSRPGTELLNYKEDDRMQTILESILIMEPPVVVETNRSSESVAQSDKQTETTNVFELWLNQIYIFFMKKLFPAYDCNEVLKVEAKKLKLRQKELDHLAKLKVSEPTSVCEQENTTKQEEEIKVLRETYSPEQSVENGNTPLPKKESPISNTVSGTSKSGVNKKKKKSI